MARACFVVRVFTRGEEGGNHLGVITDYTEISEAEMQAVATELGFSETVFVEWQPDEAPRVRIFTPAMELLFAGHPLVGTAWVLNVLGPANLDTLRCGIGDVAVRMDGDTVWITAALNQPVRSGGGDDIASRVGLGQPVRSWFVEMPKDYLILEYPDAVTVAAARPDLEELAKFFGTLIFARSGSSVRARFFAPSGGVPEDPATGSAAVALAAALASEGEETGSLSIDQGEEMGFPSRIELTWTPHHASIGGTVVRDETRFLDV